MRLSLFPVVLAVLVLSDLDLARATPGEVLVPRSDGIELYEAPRSSAPVLRTLDSNDRLLEFGREGEWVRVAVFRMVDGRGWVRLADVQAESAVQESQPVEGARDGPEHAGDGEILHRFVLDIDGTPAIAFRASCRVVGRREDEQKFDFVGLVPDRAIADARAISCIVRKADTHGRLRVALHSEDVRVATAETRAAFNWVRVRSDGPWGPAQAARGSVALVVPTLSGPSHPESTIIPPLGDPVPALQMR